MIIDASTPIALSTGLNGGRPVEPVGHRLNGVRQMPVRAERLVAVERSKAIRVGVAEHVRERRLRCAGGEQKEHAHALRPPRRRVHPGVELPVLVAQLPDAERHAPAPGAMPDVAQIRGEVAREEILMRRREHRHAAAGGLQRQRSVAHLHRHAFGLQPVRRDAAAARRRCRSRRPRCACCCPADDRTAAAMSSPAS